MDVYGDIEGNIQIISKVKTIFNKKRISIFLGDIFANYENVEDFNNSLEFLEWLLLKFTKIEHKDLSKNIYLNIWNDKGIKLSNSNSNMINEIANMKIKRVNFLIGNKEIKLYRKLKELHIDDYKLQIIETYLYFCKPFLIHNHILFSHSYYMYDTINNLINNIKRIIAGHSRSYGNYIFKNINTTILDLTSYYSLKNNELRFKKYGKPNTKLNSESDYDIGSVEFYTEEFNLKPVINF